MNHNINTQNIYEIIGYNFKNESLLIEALTHPSLSSNIAKELRIIDYERMEFLGDAVLGMIISELLISTYGTEQEGGLAKRRAALICGETISEIAKNMNLGQFIIMTEGEEHCGGRSNLANLENALEALIGAIYLDGGIEASRGFIYKYWRDITNSMKVAPRDPKTSLQEWAQKSGRLLPIYNVINTTGPSHSPLFTIEVVVENMPRYYATAPSKKLGQRIAAELMLKKIEKMNDKS